jgi:hypothetical protein
MPGGGHLDPSRVTFIATLNLAHLRECNPTGEVAVDFECSRCSGLNSLPFWSWLLGM